VLTSNSFSYDSPAAAAGSRGAVVLGLGMMRSRSGGGGGGGVRVGGVGDIRGYVRDYFLHLGKKKEEEEYYYYYLFRLTFTVFSSMVDHYQNPQHYHQPPISIVLISITPTPPTPL
jgi:hypothetical protein